MTLRPLGLKARLLRALAERGGLPVRDLYQMSRSKGTAFSRLSELRIDGLVQTVTYIELTPEGREIAQAMHDQAMRDES